MIRHSGRFVGERRALAVALVGLLAYRYLPQAGCAELATMRERQISPVGKHGPLSLKGTLDNQNRSLVSGERVDRSQGNDLLGISRPMRHCGGPIKE